MIMSKYKRGRGREIVAETVACWTPEKPFLPETHGRIEGRRFSFAMKSWRSVVRNSRSTDPTSFLPSYQLVIARTQGTGLVQENRQSYVCLSLFLRLGTVIPIIRSPLYRTMMSFSQVLLSHADPAGATLREPTSG